MKPIYLFGFPTEDTQITYIKHKYIGTDCCVPPITGNHSIYLSIKKEQR